MTCPVSTACSRCRKFRLLESRHLRYQYSSLSIRRTDTLTYHLIAAADRSSGITWEEAEAAGVARGGHLVTINDAAENQWIADTFVGSFYPWIGLSDVADEGSFVWSGGEAATYRNWWPGEPNNCCGGEDYVHMYNFSGGEFRWNDSGERVSHGQFPAHGILEIPEQFVVQLQTHPALNSPFFPDVPVVHHLSLLITPTDSTRHLYENSYDESGRRSNYNPLALSCVNRDKNPCNFTKMKNGDFGLSLGAGSSTF